jgi:PIN like domain
VSHSTSKKRSDASYTAKPPDEPTFFIDRSLGCLQVPEAFRQAGINFIPHEALFPSDARDEEWLTMAGEKGWVVLTKDDKIRYRPLERMALTGLV